MSLTEGKKVPCMAKKQVIPKKYQTWIDARKKYRLSHAHIQMARELGLNPRKFGKIANHKQEPWKEPLPVFIESIYFKRFGKRQPDEVRSIEQIIEGKKSGSVKRQGGHSPRPLRSRRQVAKSNLVKKPDRNG